MINPHNKKTGKQKEKPFAVNKITTKDLHQGMWPFTDPDKSF
jgi:hypothetical protein